MSALQICMLLQDTMCPVSTRDQVCCLARISHVICTMQRPDEHSQDLLDSLHGNEAVPIHDTTFQDEASAHGRRLVEAVSCCILHPAAYARYRCSQVHTDYALCPGCIGHILHM